LTHLKAHKTLFDNYLHSTCVVRADSDRTAPFADNQSLCLTYRISRSEGASPSYLEVAWELGHNVDKYRWTIDDVLKTVHQVTGYESSLERPVKELKGFRKVALAPGETKRVTFEIEPDMLKFYNPECGWVFEEGDFTAHVGAASDDIRTMVSFCI